MIFSRIPAPLLHTMTEQQWLPRPSSYHESSLDCLDRAEELHLDRIRRMVLPPAPDPIGLGGVDNIMALNGGAAAAAPSLSSTDPLPPNLDPNNNSNNNNNNNNNNMAALLHPPVDLTLLPSRPSFWTIYQGRLDQMIQVSRAQRDLGDAAISNNQGDDGDDDQDVNSLFPMQHDHQHPRSSGVDTNVMDSASASDLSSRISTISMDRRRPRSRRLRHDGGGVDAVLLRQQQQQHLYDGSIETDDNEDVDADSMMDMNRSRTTSWSSSIDSPAASRMG